MTFTLGRKTRDDLIYILYMLYQCNMLNELTYYIKMYCSQTFSFYRLALWGTLILRHVSHFTIMRQTIVEYFFSKLEKYLNINFYYTTIMSINSNLMYSKNNTTATYVIFYSIIPYYHYIVYICVFIKYLFLKIFPMS